jgi:serine/threonine protein kinase
MPKLETLTLFKMEELGPIFRSGNIISRGNYFETYRGYIHYLGDDKCPVAVMRSITKSVEHDFVIVKELSFQAQLIHVNILSLIDYCLDNDILVLIFGFASSKGSLDGILHGINRMPLSLDARLNIAADIACGLAYMHSSNSDKILHGDLNPDNILLYEPMKATISGIGLSRLISPGTDHVIGDRRYIDPVYLQTGELTSKPDIFSFGIVLLELLTRRKHPVPDSNWLLQDFLDAYRNNQVIQLVDPEIVVAENMELLHSITEIIVQCLNPDIDQRPEMRYVEKCLLDTLKKEKPQGKQIQCDSLLS